MGFPGKYFSKNITPAHLKSWTDGEVFRAVTTGINKQGKALFPLMPYKAYATLDPEDIKDIIAYLRSLPPIANEVPVSSSYFPMNFLINTMPTRTRFTKKPNKEEIVSYGKYLVTMASCIDCHSPVVRGQIVVEKAFSGGGNSKCQPVFCVLQTSLLIPRAELETGRKNCLFRSSNPFFCPKI